MEEFFRQTFSSEEEYLVAWNSASSTPLIENRMSEIASFVGSGLAREGFRTFHNGGLPLLTRRRGNLWDEIVFAVQPSGNDFSVRFHLNHEGVGQVRAKFWRPAIRAPKAIATGDIGLLEPEPVWAIWSAEQPARTGEALLKVLEQSVIPWLDLFDDPSRLREMLLESRVPMVDTTTAVELMLAEFDARDARRFLRAVSEPAWPPVLVPRPAGFELTQDRLASIIEYYRL